MVVVDDTITMMTAPISSKYWLIRSMLMKDWLLIVMPMESVWLIDLNLNWKVLQLGGRWHLKWRRRIIWRVFTWLPPEEAAAAVEAVVGEVAEAEGEVEAEAHRHRLPDFQQLTDIRPCRLLIASSPLTHPPWMPHIPNPVIIANPNPVIIANPNPVIIKNPNLVMPCKLIPSMRMWSGFFRFLASPVSFLVCGGCSPASLTGWPSSSGVSLFRSFPLPEFPSSGGSLFRDLPLPEGGGGEFPLFFRHPFSFMFHVLREWGGERENCFFFSFLSFFLSFFFWKLYWDEFGRVLTAGEAKDG